ncbi:MAG TPA: ATP-binding protein [Spirochaetota bacterium]|nr:ATP-binding protein [Spirochaetota bacterium]HRV14741.1 ATP-binding protein [Spirochaetota bacterium]
MDERKLQLFAPVILILTIITSISITIMLYLQKTNIIMIVLSCILSATLITLLIIFRLIHKVFFTNNIRKILSVVDNFKKGIFVQPSNEIKGNDLLSKMYGELLIASRHLDNIIKSQKNEIDKFRELYNNMMFSMNAYIMALDFNNKIIFTNELFLNKFQLSPSEVNGKNLSDIFYFLTGTVLQAIEEIKSTHESIILEKAHLISHNRISIIADIKLSFMISNNEPQIIMVMDDVTSKTKRDYQISLITRLSETIQKDDALDHILRTILTAVTSGTGLGFNRAMLFLRDDKNNILYGRMSVGPDTLDEAFSIWSSLNPLKGKEILSRGINGDDVHGRLLKEKVESTSFDLNEDTIFTQTLQSGETIHITDALHDQRVNDEIKNFIDVNEFVIVPLIALNKIIGILIADNKFNQMPITQDSVDLLTVFAYQAALSIETYNNLELLKKEMEKIRHRQEAIVESEKLAAIGRIASHIAHEIRNPLVTVGGYSRRILQTANAQQIDIQKIKKAAQIIMTETERLEKILANVMDFTRPSPFLLRFNNINEIIDDTASLLSNLFQERRVELSLQLQEVPLIKSDFNQMKQVMLNLLQNALDATPPYGIVEVKTYSDDKKVYIEVSDTGSGIVEEDIYRIFEPFYTTKTTGVGLGLAIVKKIISDHNGDIKVINKERGAVFTISIPLP